MIFKAALLFLAVMTQIGVAFADDPVQVTKTPGESDVAFVERITQHDITSPYGAGKQVATTSALIKGSETLVAFTEEPDVDGEAPGANDNDIYLQVFLKQSDLSYTWIGYVQACEVEGGSASMRSFFYTPLAGTSDMAIGVICGWDSTHRYADCQSNDEVRFFTVAKNTVDPVPMEKFDKLFYKQEQPNKHTDYNCTVAKFRNARDVENLLRTRK